MKKSKAFTLIELLAVIVILAVIALIAVPQVIKILNSARKSAAEDSTYGIIKAAETYATDFMLKNNGSIPSEIDFECDGDNCSLKTSLTGYKLDNLDKLDFKGTKPESGTIKISDSGKIITANNLKINGYTCKYENEKATCETNKSGDEDNNTTTTTTTVAKEILENKTYQVGDAVILADYNWHVINDDGTNVTLLMDAKELSNMNHCTDDLDATTDCGVDSTGTYYVYSWDKSLIRTYLNKVLYSEISNKITNQIVSTEICADPSRGDGVATYGGYLTSELNGASCTTKVSDSIRLISPNEYTTLKSNVSDTTWLYSNDIGYWWGMGAYFNTSANFVKRARNVSTDGDLHYNLGQYASVVRPVITIEK